MLALKYILFAVIATAVNLSSQFVTFTIIEKVAFLSILENISLVLGILVGTATGLLTKYILDKKYIFKFQASSLLFDLLLKTDSARYIGAIVGLSIGYAIKYFLDKRFVFKSGIA